MFFFRYYRCSVYQSVRPIIALRVVRVWSLLFIRKWDSMGTRAVMWLLTGSSLIPSDLFVLSSLWLVITQSTLRCVIPRDVWQQLLSLRKLSSIPFHAPLLFMFCQVPQGKPRNRVSFVARKASSRSHLRNYTALSSCSLKETDL